jgi:hypothetical protein
MKAQKPLLQGLVEALDGVISKAVAEDLRETVALLNIARLDLLLRAHGFSEEELEALLVPLRNRLPDLESARASQAKSRRARGACAVGHC